MVYTLTIVGSAPEPEAGATSPPEEQIETAAKAFLSQLPGVTNARAEFGSGGVTDLLAEAPDTAHAQAPVTEGHRVGSA